MSDRARPFSTPYYRAFCTTVLALIALAILAILGERGGPNWPGWVFLAITLAALLRAIRLGLVVTPDDVIIRSWYTTRRIPHSDILSARATSYDSFWLGIDSNRLCQLQLQLRDRPEPLPVRALVATVRSRRIQRIAYQLRSDLSKAA